MNGHCYVPIKLYLQNRWQARFGLWIVVGNPSSSQVQWSRDLSLGGVRLLLSCSVGWTQCVKDPVCHRIETRWFQLISNTVIFIKLLRNVYLSFFFLQWVFIAAHGLSLVAVSEGYSLVAVQGLLVVVASLGWSVGSRAHGFHGCNSWALEHRLSSCSAQA